MSLINSDENKTFGAVFRTPVDNSKGIPHILEHSVLCGPKKYPIKEPFVELMKGSLNTFLNAFTYPDRTCYPVASTNLQVASAADDACRCLHVKRCRSHAHEAQSDCTGRTPGCSVSGGTVAMAVAHSECVIQDYYNLVDVYLDAVLYPNCVQDPKTFAQEGWHYELEKPEVSGSLCMLLPAIRQGLVLRRGRVCLCSACLRVHEVCVPKIGQIACLCRMSCPSRGWSSMR